MCPSSTVTATSGFIREFPASEYSRWYLLPEEGPDRRAVGELTVGWIETLVREGARGQLEAVLALFEAARHADASCATFLWDAIGRCTVKNLAAVAKAWDSYLQGGSRRTAISCLAGLSDEDDDVWRVIKAGSRSGNVAIRRFAELVRQKSTRADVQR